MTVSASAEGHDDIINTSITDVAGGNMAQSQSDYENNPVFFFTDAKASSLDKGRGCKAPNTELLLCSEACL